MNDNPIVCLTSALASAQYKDMPKVKDSRRKFGSKPYKGDRANIAEYKKWQKSAYETYERDHFADELHVCTMFLQTWGSTALGFGGMGGQALTSAYTIIVYSNVTLTFCVYFGGRFAYSLDDKTIDIVKFDEDVRYKNMAPVAEKGRYLK